MKYSKNDYYESARYLELKIGKGFKALVILGTGLNSLEKLVEIQQVIPYESIPGFVSSTAPFIKGV